MSRFLSIAKTLCKQQARFATSSNVRRAPMAFSVKSYSTSFPAFGDAHAHKDEVGTKIAVIFPTFLFLTFVIVLFVCLAFSGHQGCFGKSDGGHQEL